MLFGYNKQGVSGVRDRGRERYRENYRLLGLRIAYYRKMRGYTQEQLAELTGMSWSFLSQIEANNGAAVKGVSLDTLYRIAEELRVPIGKFFEQD